MPDRFQLRLFDGFHLEQEGRALRVPHSARRLVALLGIRGRCGRTDIAATLWRDVPERTAQARLRTVLWRLHRLTADPVVTGRKVLGLAATVDADVPAFVAAARHSMHGGAADRSSTPALVIGDLLPGWYEDWVLVERERLRLLQMHALEAVATQLTAAGRYADAIDAALAAVRLEPLREAATRALIVAHLAENNIVEAVRCLTSFRNGLASEFGAAPTPELEQLVQSSLNRTA